MKLVKDDAPRRDAVPPHDLDAEAAVLSAVMLDPDVVDELAAVLRADDFYSPGNRRIWEAIVSLAAGGEPVDAVTVARRLKEQGRLAEVGGATYLVRICDAAPSVANLPSYARIVTQCSRMRSVIREAQAIAAEAYEDGVDPDKFIERAEARISAIARDGGDQKGATLMRELVRDTFQDVEDRAAGKVIPVMSGFVDLDRLLVSETGEVQIVAARPAMGKTSFAMNIATNLASASAPTATVVFSLEMAEIPLVKRMVASDAGVDLGSLRRGALTAEQWTALTASATRLSKLPIAISSAPGISVLAMRSQFRKARADLEAKFPGVPVRAVVVDYLQLMGRNPNSRAGNREQEVSEISRALCEFSLEEKVLVIALSQLNRSVESRQDKRPGMADLRESGAIEQDATSIVFLYRDEVYDPNSKDKGLCEAIVGKSRNGDTSRVMLGFDGKYTRFSNLDRGHAW